MNETLIFEPKPRWPGAPPTCELDCDLAFASTEELFAFHEANAPGARILKVWKCAFCGRWHYKSKPRPPSGDSSGLSRR